MTGTQNAIARARTGAARQRPEQALQIQIVNALHMVAPDVLVNHVPNGGYRTPAEARAFKAMGVLPGWPDLQCSWAVGRIGFLELKADKGALTPAQDAMHATLREMGFEVAVARSVVEAVQALIDFGAPVRGRIAA